MPQSILFNTSIAAAGRVANVALGLVVVKLLTQFLGPSGYGSYALLISFGTILQLVADFGLYLHLTRAVAAEPERQSEIASTIFSLRIALLVFSFILGLFLSTRIPPLHTLTWPFSIIAVGLAWQSLSQLYLGIFQYQQAVWRATLGDLVGRLAQIGAVFFLGVRSTALGGMAVAFTIGSGITLLFHHLVVPPLRLRPVLRWSSWQPILSSAWPLGLLLLLNAIYFRIDTVILSLFRPTTEVGWYGLAYRVIESALFFPAMFGGLLLPRLSEAAARHDPSRLQKYLSQGLTLQLVVVGFVVVTLLVRAQAIILLIADVSFLPAVPLLQLLSLALASMFFGNIFGFAMIALQKQMTLLALYAVLAIITVIGASATIPYWGTTAAAVTTIITEVVATIGAGWFIRRSVPYRVTGRSVVGTAVAMCLALAVYSAVSDTWPLVVQIILAGTGYAVAIGVAKVVTREQLSLLRGASTVG